jgi:hypothetical protein
MALFGPSTQKSTTPEKVWNGEARYLADIPYKRAIRTFSVFRAFRGP